MAGGLCLLVKPSGARTWLLRMQKDGRRRDYGLGSAIDVSLAEAREAAIALRRKVREGCDPVAERRKARKVVPNFEKAARDCRSEEHTSELQSLMRISYAVFCLKKKKNTISKRQTQQRQIINIKSKHNFTIKIND